MPNMPFWGYQNQYNQNPNESQNNLTLNAYLEIQNRLKELEKKINNLSKHIESIEKEKNNNIFEYQTSMNMM